MYDLVESVLGRIVQVLSQIVDALLKILVTLVEEVLLGASLSVVAR